MRPHQPEGEDHISPLQPEDGLFPRKEAHHPYCREHLGEDGGQGRAPHAHIQHEDKERIQQNIGNGSQHDGQHSLPRKALGIDKAVHSQAEHHKDRAQ